MLGIHKHTRVEWPLLDYENRLNQATDDIGVVHSDDEVCIDYKLIESTFIVPIKQQEDEILEAIISSDDNDDPMDGPSGALKMKSNRNTSSSRPSSGTSAPMHLDARRDTDMSRSIR
jgi:hypothetical protein